MRCWGQLRVVAFVAGLLVTLPVTTAAGRVADPPRSPDAPDHLLVDGLPRPIGIDDAPHFAWHVRDDRRGAVQRAYHVLVGTAPMTGPGDAGVVWDSGEVTSNREAFVAYEGPALASDSVFWWTVATADDAGHFGAYASPERFETGLHDTDWRAQWIRRATTDSVDAADDYTYARKEFALGSSPVVRARVYVSGDHQYQLSVNGTRVGAGQAFNYPDSQYYEAWDVSALLQPGARNALGVLYHWYGVGKGRPEGVSGVLAELSIEHADGTAETIGTDGSWRVSRAPWLPATQRNTEGDPVDYTEHVDGAAIPPGWDRAGFDDRLWATAVALGSPPVAPWTHLTALRTHIVEEPMTPVSVTQLSDGSVVADFGRVIAAVPTVSFHNGLAGRAVAMHAGYLLDEPAPGTALVGVPGQVSTTHGTQHTDMSYAYIEASGSQTFRPFDYLGFRYLQVDNPGEPLDASQLVAYARHSSFPDDPRASFTSSDPTVDAVFALALHSATYGSQEQFIDTPTREKGPFLRDGFNISEVAMHGLGDENLTRRALLEYAQSQTRYWPDGRLNAIYPSGQGKRDIPDFTEIYPEWVWQYYVESGDDDTLGAVYPVMAAVADYVARAVDPGTGLVTNLPGGDGDYQYGIVDWPSNMRYGYDMATVARTTVNALAVDVFDRVSRAADVLGRRDDAETQRARRATLIDAMNRRLTRPDGVYVDGLRADGTPSDHASQHANAYALAYGIAPPSTRDAIAAYVAGMGTAMGPQTAQLLLSALHLGARDADVVNRITDTKSDGWANVLARGGTFTWETWQPSDADGDSMSHAWGSTVLVNIQEALLGVTSTGPGGDSVDVRPPVAGLDHATGTVPTGRGPVAVSWQRPAEPDGTFTLAVTVPPNASARISIPATSSDAVTEGGQPVRHADGVQSVEQDGDLVVVRVGSGEYAFASGSVPVTYTGHTEGHPVPGAAAGGSDDATASTASAATPSIAGGGPSRVVASAAAGAAHRPHGPAFALVVLVAAAQLIIGALAWRVYRTRNSTPRSTV